MENGLLSKKKLLFFFLPFLAIVSYDIIGNGITEALFFVLDLLRIPFDWVNNNPAFLDAFLATCLSVIFYIFYRKVFPVKKAETKISSLLFSLIVHTNFPVDLPVTYRFPFLLTYCYLPLNFYFIKNRLAITINEKKVKSLVRKSNLRRAI